MIPESKLIRSQITLRDMALTQEVKMARKSLVRWVALSLGLIHPNESRRLLLDILDALFYFQINNKNPTTQDVLDKLKSDTNAVPNSKAVYYHLLKLKDSGFIIRKKGRYFIGYEGDSRQMDEIIREIYFSKCDSSFMTISEALKKLQVSYNE